MHEEADKQNLLNPAVVRKNANSSPLGPVTRKEIEEIKKLIKLNKNALWKFLRKKGK